MSLHDNAMKSKPLFNSHREALENYAHEYDMLGAKYYMTGDEFWMELDRTLIWTQDHYKIQSLRMRMQVCLYMMGKCNA